METNYRELIEKFNKAFQINKPDIFLDYCHEDAVWNILGEQRLQGRQAISDFLEPMRHGEPAGFEIQYTIVDNDRVASTGFMTMPAKDGQASRYSFCDIYQFESGKIKEMITYMVALSKPDKA